VSNVSITGSAVALHCCKAHAEIDRKIENSTPCKIVLHEDFNLKLSTRDYVGDTTQHTNPKPLCYSVVFDYLHIVYYFRDIIASKITHQIVNQLYHCKFLRKCVK